MDEQTLAAKKTTLRMIPYGLYILAAKNGDEINAGAINWVTQTSFDPPLVVMGVKKDSGLYSTLIASGNFALSFLESGQKDLAFAFFKPTSVDGNAINGHEYTVGTKLGVVGAPDDLEYACIFDLPTPRDCSDLNVVSCDCSDPKNDNPLCEPDPVKTDSRTTQKRAHG